MKPCLAERVMMRLRQVRVWGPGGTLTALARLLAERRIGMELRRSMRRNRGTRPSRGITVVAPLKGSTSLCKTMRDFVERLRDAGIPFQTFDTDVKNRESACETDYSSLLTPRGEFDLMKYDHTVEMLNSPLPACPGIIRCRIAFWESESGLLDVFPYLSDSDVVIAMSDFNSRYYRRALPDGVRVSKIQYPLIPPPADVLDKSSARRRFGLADDDFVVFYNFDMRASGRKNPEGTLEAFAEAFPTEPRCILLLKVNGSRVSRREMSALRELAGSLGILSRMRVVTDYLSERDLYSLTNTCDVYMSLHRAEGFGLGIAEAMSLGKAVVATGYSATTEFCGEDNSVLVPFEMRTAAGSGMARHFGTWAEPDVHSAAMALRKLFGDAGLRGRLGERAMRSVEERFSIDAFRRSVEAMLDLECGVRGENHSRGGSAE